MIDRAYSYRLLLGDYCRETKFAEIDRILDELEKARGKVARYSEKLEYIRSAYCDNLGIAKEMADAALAKEPKP